MAMSKSQLLSKLKQTAKGAWKNARQVEPKARGGGGLPPNLKNVVCVARAWKFAETQKGDPFFTLTGIIKDHDTLTDRRATIMWFINESEYATVEDNLNQLANDLGLLLPTASYDVMPEALEDILEVLKEIVEEGKHFLINTGKERSNGRSPNIFIQGLADGYEDDPTTAENAPKERPPRGRSSGGATSSGSNGADDDAGAGSPVGDDSPPDGDGDSGGEPVAEDPPPEVGNDFYYIPTKGDLKGKKVILNVTKVNADKQTVDGQTKKQRPNMAYKGIPWSQLLGE